MQPQLLDLFVTSSTFANFIPLANEQAVDLLKNQSNQFIHIAGKKHSGKSHLLMAWVNLAYTKGRTAIYIDSNQPITHNIRELTSKFSFIAIDNIDCLREEIQIALFDLFNSIKLNNRENYLLTSSTSALNTLNLRNDLKTRILSGLNLNLKTLNDNELKQALSTFTIKEGIRLDDVEQNYLINHYTRNIGDLIKATQRLAEAAVLEKRNITIPFIKQVLK